MSSSGSGSFKRAHLVPERITAARLRRGLSKTELARRLAVTPRTISTYERAGAPSVVEGALARALDFPVEYFTRENAPQLNANGISFRAGRRASAAAKGAAIAAGASGVEIDAWTRERFILPTLDLPDLSDHTPVMAAQLLRHLWGMGTQPLPNLLQLAESRGIRVFGLPRVADIVDAYSWWVDGEAFIFLARRRSPEGVRFDLAHEIGHLVLHSHHAEPSAEQEREADAFASEFLLPAESLSTSLRHNAGIEELLYLARHYVVSAMATAYAAHRAGRLSDWTYRTLCAELSQRGFRSSEPGGLSAYERSRVYGQVFSDDNRTRYAPEDIARELAIPVQDVHALTHHVRLHSIAGGADAAGGQRFEDASRRAAPVGLRLIPGGHR